MEKDVTRTIEEQLSAFLDGELPEGELQLLVRRLERDEELRATLARYAAVGSVLRQEPIHLSGNDLRRRLLVTIESEQLVGPDADAEVLTKAQGGNGFRTLLVAGVAALAVLGVYVGDFADPGLAGDGDAIELTAAANTAAADSESALPVSRYTQPATRQASIDPDRMTSYLVSHGEYSRSLHGTIVDSRIFVQQASFER